MIIYKTTNLINGKFYVGKDTKNDPNYLGSGILIRRAIRKYGRENFSKEILQHCDSLEALDTAEKFWILSLDAINKGYNLASGGNGGKTTPVPWNKGLTKETDLRVKMNGIATGKALKGKIQSEATKSKRSQSMKGQKRTEETKAKQSRSIKALYESGWTLSKEIREEIAQKLRKSIKLKCVTCGKEFERTPSREMARIKDNRAGPFCSHSCSSRGTARPPKLIKVTCLNCNVEFEKKVSRERERLADNMKGPFCGRSCARRYKSN